MKNQSVVETFFTEQMARQFSILVAIQMKHLEAGHVLVRKKSATGDEWNVLGFRLTQRDAHTMESLAEGFRTGYCYAKTGELYFPEQL